MFNRSSLGVPSLIRMLIAVVLFSSTAWAQTSAVRIMPLGDSITGSPGCWRALLWDHLQKTGVTNIDFVGTQPPQGCSIPYDGDSEGHGGALATSVADQNQLPVWLAATHPDIVIMHFGTNDVWSGRTTPVILAAFSKLVDQMRASNPNMIILVAQIIPVNPSTCADCAQRTIDLNAAIPAWAASKTTAASPILVVDQWTGFVSATDTSEGVHPNAAGDQKIADKWYPVLFALLSQPTSPGFTLSASPPVPSIVAGGTGTSTIGINRVGGFTGPVSLSTVSPVGWTATFNPNSVAGNSSLMTITVPSGAPAGLQVFNVVGTSASLTGSTTVTVNVTAPLIPFFTIFATRGSQTLARSTSVVNTITIDRINNFTGPVDLSVSGLPVGVTASFSPTPVLGTGTSSVLTFAASPTAAVGTAVVTVTGIGAPGTRTFPVNLTVVDPSTSPCGVSTPIALPFARDGIGDLCFSTSADIAFVNSWNMQLVEINGVPFTNKWANSLPPRINGNYYIHYVATVSFAHFEATGTSVPPPPPPPPPPPVNNLTVAPASLAFDLAAASRTASVTSNVSWSVVSNQSWLTVVPATGVNNGTLTLNAAANTGTVARSATVTISGGGLSQTISVSQSGATPPPPPPPPPPPATVCASPTAIALPFTQNGVGEFCWVTSGNITFINSWNIQLLEVNGVAFTNKWASSLPPRINGNYYIHYISTVPWAHFEANGSP